MANFREINWAFDVGPTYRGFTDGTYWNGFTNVWVRPEVRDQIVADLRRSTYQPDDSESADDIAAIPIGDDGLVLCYGYATTEV